MLFYIGIALEEKGFQVAILKKEKEEVAIESLHTFLYEQDHVKLFYNLSPFHTGKSVHLVSGLGSEDIFIRKLHLPLTDRGKILKILPFQLESLIPFTPEQPIVCAQLKCLGKQMTSVTIIATVQEKLLSHLRLLEQLNIEPDTVSCAPMALVRFAHWQFPHEKKLLCFDCRESQISCSLVEEGELILSQTLKMQKGVAEQFLLFLTQKGVADENTPWLLTGEHEAILEIGKVFLGKQLCITNPTYGPFALPIGLGLDACAQDGNSLQFCQKQLLQPHTIKKRKKGAILYAIACLSAALLMSVLGSFSLKQKENVLREKLLTYLPQAKNIHSVEGISQTLASWEYSYKGKKTPFPLMADVPRVSDLLSYLSTHPALTAEGVEIQSVHYSLTKYPKIAETSSPYTARVELDISSTTPRAARDFHEALLKGDAVVNEKKEIKWQTQNQTYHTSFELMRRNAP